MENKQLTTRESLDLITDMIVNTRRNFNNNGGMTMMIWGYVSALVSVAVYTTVTLTANPAFYWMWWAIPVLGFPLSRIARPKSKSAVRTYMDRIVDYVWMVFGIACGAIVIIYSLSPLLTAGWAMYNVLLLVGITMSMSVAITGLIIRFRPTIISGFAGILLSLLLPLLPWLAQTLGLGIIFLLVMAIPGHLLNRAEKKESHV